MYRQNIVYYNMSIGERHKWCTSKILESFAEVDNEQVQSFIRQESVLQKFNAFFKGESSGRLFVLYQPLVVDGEVKLPLSAQIYNCVDNLSWIQK